MKSLKILVIDDEQVICDACRLVLTERGHTVAYCNTGREGQLELERRSYDLVLLDMKLPDIDGTRVLEFVAEKEVKTCVVVMTGYSTMGNAISAMKLGAADYLSKPFSEDELLATIDQLFAGT